MTIRVTQQATDPGRAGNITNGRHISDRACGLVTNQTTNIVIRADNITRGLRISDITIRVTQQATDPGRADNITNGRRISDRASGLVTNQTTNIVIRADNITYSRNISNSSVCLAYEPPHIGCTSLNRKITIDPLHRTGCNQSGKTTDIIPNADHLCIRRNNTCRSNGTRCNHWAIGYHAYSTAHYCVAQHGSCENRMTVLDSAIKN